MTQEQQAPKKRVRIEVGTSTKGVHTYSATVELVSPLEGTTAQEIRWVEGIAQAVLDESDWLVAKLDKRYPAPGVE